MIQVNAVQAQAESHRRDLAVVAGSRRGVRRHTSAEATHATRAAPQRSAAGLPVTGGRAVRRGATARVGAWLIEVGTRLGGATVRTSS